MLLDVLQIAKERKYFVLDPVQQDPVQQKMNVTLASKKRVGCLAEAAELLPLH